LIGHILYFSIALVTLSNLAKIIQERKNHKGPLASVLGNNMRPSPEQDFPWAVKVFKPNTSAKTKGEFVVFKR